MSSRHLAPIALYCIAWLLMASGSASAAGRTPDPVEAQACVQSLMDSLDHRPLREEDLDRWFAPPAGSLAQGKGGLKIDHRHLQTLLGEHGALGLVLRSRPEILAVVQGPDYTRVVLATEPHISFVMVRDGSGALIQRWETTHCGDCREPVRFVTDLLVAVREGLDPVLLPGMDLHLDGDRPGDTQQATWKHAFVARNASAGYLRWLLRDAEVLGYEMEGVRVSYQDQVETWPVSYRDGRWGIDYEQLPPDSPLRLDRAEVSHWREDAHVRQHGREWWQPMERRTVDGGTLWAEHAVGVAWQSVQQRWLLALERPDGLMASLIALERDATVAQRRELPHWPGLLPKPVRRWARSWVMALAPSGRELLLAGANRWWLVSLEEPSIRLGPRGVMGSICAASWSDDGSWLAIGDERGHVGLIPAGSSSPDRIRYLPGSGPPVKVAGLAFLPGQRSLLVAWGDGSLRRLGLPDLAEKGEPATLCCGMATGLAVHPGRGDAVLACGGGCPPLAVTTVSLWGEGKPAQLGDVVLSPSGGVVSTSPDGRWIVLAAAAPGRSAALCRAHDLAPVAVFSDVPLVQVAWSDGGESLLALREDGSAVHWTLDTILAQGRLRQDLEP